MRMKTGVVWALFLSMLLPEIVLAEEQLEPGSVRLVGQYKRQRLSEGQKQKTYFTVEANKPMRLRAAGPASIVMLARGQTKHHLSFELRLDDAATGQAELEVLSHISRGFYLPIPAGQHDLTLMASGQVMLRPVRVRRPPMSGETVVAWESTADLAPVSLTAPEDTAATRPREPEPVPPPVAVATAQEQPAATGLSGPEAPANEQKPAGKTPVPPGALDIGSRPVEVRLRILADRLAAGFAQMPGKGRYERIAVAEFQQSGAAVRDLELGALVSAQLNTYLKRDHDFFVLERARLADVFKEMELAMLGVVDTAKAAEIGKMAGAQAIVVGQISEAGADFLIDARLISAETAGVLVAESISVPRSGLVALSESSVVLRTRSGAIFRSLLVPGWGQFYNRQPVKGGILIGAEVAVIGAAVAMHLLGQGDEDDYHAADFAQQYPDLSPTELGQKAQALRESAEDFYQARNALIWAAAGVWLYNILDATIFGTDGESDAGFELTPTSGPNAGAQLGIGF